ncbi:unnamed protein product [Moneuplotes crassus]|uniref:Uncharacterized protein n=2 Tax=Euplotes crassus TaxID=5936 RepID=A0AAD2D8U2_EUPCR|nr:unnamed protein product [Moneuplotes crassus]
MEVRRRGTLGNEEESECKKIKDSSLMNQLYLNKPEIRPGSSHHGRAGIPDTFTPPCRSRWSKKELVSEICEQLASKNGRHANGKQGRVDSLGYYNKNTNSCANSSFRKPKSSHKNSRDVNRVNSGSNSSKHHKVSKGSHGRSKIKSENKKKRRDHRCGSSIAPHKLNRSLFGTENESIHLDKRRSSKKISVRSRSKSKKSPKAKKFEESFANTSFHNTNLDMSQMFNYYSNYPTKNFLKSCTGNHSKEKNNCRKLSKNLNKAYRSYISNKVPKKGKSKSKGRQPYIIVQTQNKKSKNVPIVLDSSQGRHNKSSNKGKSKNSRKSSTNPKIAASIKDWTDARYTRMDLHDQYNSPKKFKEAKKLSTSYCLYPKGINPTGQRKKSGKRSRCRDENISRAKSKDRDDRKNSKCNSAISTYQNSIMRKDQSPVSFFCPENSQLNEDALIMDRMQENMKLTTQIKKLGKDLKKDIKSIDSKCNKAKRSVNTPVYSTKIEEEKINCALQTLFQISELDPFSSKLFSIIKEGVEGCIQNLECREKHKNIQLQGTLKKTEEELNKEKIEKELLECQYTEMQQRIKKMHKLDKEYKKLRLQLAQHKDQEHKFNEQINWLHGREQEVIKRLDLGEIDLLTDRLGVFGVEVEKEEPKPMKKNPVPPIDMEKVRLTKEQDEYEDEEEEEEEEDAKAHKQYLEVSSAVKSSDQREEDLKKRKEKVLSLLNETFQEN